MIQIETLDKIQMHFIFDDGGFDYFMTNKIFFLIPNVYTMLIVESIQTHKFLRHQNWTKVWCLSVSLSLSLLRIK